MLFSYLKIALRNLKRYPVYTAINLFGLSVGMAACLLIFLFVRDELSYDRSHENADRIFRVVNERSSESTTVERASTPPGLAAALKEDYPEVKETARVYYLGRTLVRHGDRTFFEPGVLLADSSVFDVFTLPLVQGDPSTALAAPFSLVISESLAKKYFGEAEALGQTLDLSTGEDFTITGILRDPPDHSHLNFSMIGSFETMYSFESEERLSNWIWQQFYTYVLLDRSASREALQAKLPDLVARRAQPETENWGFTYAFSLQPLRDIYLRSTHLELDYGPRGNILYVRILSAIAAFILLIACFNFINLTTARAMRRAREVGLRKVVGADRGRVVRQFLGESTLTACLGFAIALMLTWLALPAVNGLTGKAMSLDSGTLRSLLLPVLVILGVTGIAAGAYPAFYLAGFKPVAVLKGQTGSGAGGAFVRKALVVVQFAISIGLVAGTAIILTQLDFIQTRDLGFRKDLLVKVPARSGIRDNVSAVLDELNTQSSIVNATASWGTPGSFEAGDDVRLPGSDDRWTTNMYLVDYDFIPTYDMEMVSGRAFDRDHPSDADHAFVINEAAAAALGWNPSDAVGKELLWDRWDADSVKDGTVIGVVRDFNYKSLRTSVEPLVMHMSRASVGQVSIRIASGGVTDALDEIEKVWKEYAPGWPFEYEFLDAELAENYISEESLATTTGLFSGLAMLIACLGLFGLASFVVARRTREIGVRKVLGASSAGIIYLISREFLVLVGAAAVIALPAAHFGMQTWIRNFAFQAPVGVSVYVLTALAAVAVAFLTIGAQALKASRTDPAETLRYE